MGGIARRVWARIKWDGDLLFYGLLGGLVALVVVPGAISAAGIDVQAAADRSPLGAAVVFYGAVIGVGLLATRAVMGVFAFIGARLPEPKQRPTD